MLLGDPSAADEHVARRMVMPGTPYGTPFYVKRSGLPGPTVVVIGGVHGDEPAGYLAARKLANWRIRSGTLVVMPEASRQAIRRGVRGYPEDLNRQFPGRSDGSDMERLAHAIFQDVIAAPAPDLLLSLHESVELHARDPSRYGQTLTYDSDELTPLMERALGRVNEDIDTPLHKFVPFCKPIATCPTYHAYRRLGVPATGIETSRTLPLDTRVRYQLMVTMAFLDEFGMRYEQADLPYLSTGERALRDRTRQPDQKARGRGHSADVPTDNGATSPVPAAKHASPPSAGRGERADPGSASGAAVQQPTPSDGTGGAKLSKVRRWVRLVILIPGLALIAFVVARKWLTRPNSRP